MDFSGLPERVERIELSDRQLRPTRLPEIWASIGAVLFGGLAWAVAAWRLDAYYDDLPADGFNGLAYNSGLFSIVAIAASAGGVLGLLRGCSLARQVGVAFRSTHLVAMLAGAFIACVLGVLAVSAPAVLLGSVVAAALAIAVPALSAWYGTRLGFRLAPAGRPPVKPGPRQSP
jgi:hypothetical protein